MPDNRNGFLHAPLTSAKPNDIVISPDGARIYTSTPTGWIYAYDMDSRALLDRWQPGVRLGGLDVSPDGSFLMAVELVRIGYKPSSSTHDPRTTVTVYKVDTSTGDKTSFPLVIEGHIASVFNDVAVLRDGTAVLSHVMYGLPARLLDTDTGTYFSADWGIDGGYGVFVPSLDRSRAMLSTSVSSVPLYIYEATGRVDSRSGFDDNFSGYSQGIVAYSAEAGLAVQQLYSLRTTDNHVFTNLYVYDDALDLKLDLLSLHPEWSDGRISGLAFSPSGDSLFVLDDDTDSIVQLSTADWHTVRSFAVGADIGNHADGDYGSRLLVSPDGQYFTVVTATGARVVANDSLANDFTGSLAADDLSAGLGNDRLSGGGGNDRLRGDAGADLLRGDAGDDRLEGGTGNDRIDGGAGTDALLGDSGNDRLVGGAGADTMAGGPGHDSYAVDAPGDAVIEYGSSGNDTVESSIDYRLPTHVEKLILTGTSGIDGRGNSGANTITGNSGGNFLNGGGGNDIIDAGAGNDRILGGSGNDTLKGGAGIDRFEFISALGATNVDKILDFSVPSDTVYLMRSIFTRAGPEGTLGAAAFHRGPAAADASDRIVYDQATGKIFYDADGSGAAAAMLFATVTPGTPLTHADFMIYG